MASSKFLNYEGLEYFYNQLLTKFPEGTDFDTSKFTVVRDNETQKITSVTLNLGNSLKVVSGTGGAPDKIEVDLDALFTQMFEDYVVPQEKESTDTVNGGKSVLRINPEYLRFEYPDSNSNNIRLTVNVNGIAESLVDNEVYPDPEDPQADIPTGVIYYNTTTNKLEYTLPAASASVRGGIKVGEGLEITASTDDVLKAKVDNTTIEINNSGALRVKAGAFAPLDSNGKVPSDNLPSYVDDVIEGYYRPANPDAVPPVTEGFFGTRTGSGTEQDPYVYTDPITPETGKIYMDLDDDDTYRWGGTRYVQIGGADIDVITTTDIDNIINPTPNP